MGLDLTVFFNKKNILLNKRLVSLIKKAQIGLYEYLRQSPDIENWDNEETLAFLQYVVHSIDCVMREENWQDFRFLWNVLAPLRKVHQSAVEWRECLTLDRAVPGVSILLPHPVDKISVYFSLYQRHGEDLQQWCDQLKGIPASLVGRPIYKDEADVLRVFRVKQASAAEAYLAIALHPCDVLSTQPVRKDAWGHELLTVLPRALKPEYITYFSHLGKQYIYRNQSLELLHM